MQSGSTPLVLVTGGTGYIAAQVILSLLETKRYRVRTTMRKVENAKKSTHLYKWKTQFGEENLEIVAADLNQDAGWDTAVKGCTYVLHTASPFPMGPVENPEESLYKPAIQGTVCVLKAALTEKLVKRVVVTSSMYSVIAGNYDTPNLTTATWGKPEFADSYGVSKIKAEQAAWKFMEDHKDATFELTTVLPGLVMGPTVTESDEGTSSLYCKGIFTGMMGELMQISFPFVDVRDVAVGHLLAMEKPEAAKQRIALCRGTQTLKDIADAMVEKFGPLGYKSISTKVMEKSPEAMVSIWGKPLTIDNSETVKILGMSFRAFKETMADMVENFFEKGFLDRNAK